MQSYEDFIHCICAYILYKNCERCLNFWNSFTAVIYESILKIIFFYGIVRKTIPSEFRFKWYKIKKLIRVLNIMYFTFDILRINIKIFF